MEHRETPRIVPAEGRPRDARADLEADRPRFARFVNMPSERRVVISRLGLAALASILALLAVGLLGTHAVEQMVVWLHGRPQYRTTFGAIELVPAPPEWFRGGSRVFLDGVRKAAQRPDEPFSYLDADLAELGREFRLYCWVKRFVHAEKHAPNRIIVRLEYRTPVARATIVGKALGVPLDEDAVILLDEDIDEEKVGPLIRIERLEPPFEPRPGRVWAYEESSTEHDRGGEGVLAAARLASFLKLASARESTSIPAAMRPVAIHVARGEKKNFLFLENAERTMILWGEAPGLESPGRPTAQQKWEDLRAWIKRRPPRPVAKPYYLDFHKDGVVIRKEPG